MLLLHRGGIRPSRGSDVFNSQHFMTVSDAVQRFAADTLNAKPGTTTIYSNEGYVLLACAIEGASGGSYDEYVKRAVLLPSGMPHTQPENVYEVLPHLSRSYLVRTAENTKAWEGLWTPVQLALIQLDVPAVAERVDPSHFPGAGNYRSTPSDMLRFMLALESGKLVSDSMRAFELATDFPLTDGKPSGRSMGWQVTPMDDRLVPRMLGSDWNGSFGILTLPDKRFSIAVASNIEFDIPYDLVRRIASLWGFLRPSE
jgi:CubicO group peptidase (beta-lactamase class C family)